MLTETDNDCTADRAVKWAEQSWRRIVYSFLAGVALTALVECSTADAFEVTKPAGTPEVFLPEYGLSVAVFAVTSPVGSGLVVGEKLASGRYEVCGVCSRFVTDLPGEVAFKGGEVPYIASMRPDINLIFSQRFPPISGPVGNTALERLNYALGAGYKITASGLQQK